MAKKNAAAAIPDPRSGFCKETRTYQSLHPPTPMPPESQPLSYTEYAFSLLPRPFPDRAAIVLASATATATVSFSELATRVRSLAAFLRHHLGVSKGDVAFILSPARLEIPALYLALFSVGAVVAAANPLSTPAELDYLVGLCSPSFFFATSEHAGNLPGRRTATVAIDSPLFQSMMTAAPPAVTERPFDLVEVRQGDAAAIQFSSGTTGRVKAAALSHRSFISQVARWRHIRAMPPPDDSAEAVVVLSMAPMFHSMGFFMAVKTVAMGETNVVAAGRMTVEQVMEAVGRHRVTHVMAAPPVVVAMSRMPTTESSRSYDLSTLRSIWCGGAPLPVGASLRFASRFPGVEIRQGLGSTEGGGISMMVEEEECRRLQSVGRLLANVEAMVVDIATQEALPPGKEGELWLRGPTTMLGYVGDPEANATAFGPGSWLKTGDVCYFDDEGYLYVVDRLKELIKYKGYQVPPAELEQVILSHPHVLDAAVIPYPHEEAGQIPMACVVKRAGSEVSEVELIEFVAKQVAPYKKVRKVAFVGSIPRSPTGKILRREIVVTTAATSRL